MAAIARLGVVKLDTVAEFDNGAVAFTADDSYLLSLIITNTVSTDADAYVYVKPADATGPEDYGLITYRLRVSGYNTYETFRFGVNNTDVVEVAGSAGLAFYVQGIDQVTV